LQRACAAIDRGFSRQAGSREIDLHRVARDANHNLNGDLRRIHAVAVDHVLGAIDAIRKRRDYRTRFRFAGAKYVVEDGEGRLPPVTLQRLDQSPFRHADGRELGVDIAKNQRGKPHILDDYPLEVIEDAVASRKPDAGQAEPFLKDGACVRRQAPRLSAADIEEVRHGDGEGDDFAPMEDRSDDREIAGVRAALIGIIGQERIPRRHRAFEPGLDEAHLARKRACEKCDAVGLRKQAPIGVAEAAGEIQHLVDHRTHARACEHDRHFVDQRQKTSADDLSRHVGGAGTRRLRFLHLMHETPNPNCAAPK
jgi:hypothetical protein